jgi:hypothetical protein
MAVPPAAVMMSVRILARIVRMVATIIVAPIIIASRVIGIWVPYGIIAGAIAPVGVAAAAIGVAMTIGVAIALDMRISTPAAHSVSMAATMNNAHRRAVSSCTGEAMMKRGSAGVKCVFVNSRSRKSM